MNERLNELLCELPESGYAYDLAQAVIAGTACEQDADSLFRALVLDEGWDVESAREVWEGVSCG